ncbi:MAG: hypothetical protein QOK45_3058 [Mycobacterium sp.]|jgi:hypothetical protein|nr:hypothetical protein [Mycobacterium sp.]
MRERLTPGLVFLCELRAKVRDPLVFAWPSGVARRIVELDAVECSGRLDASLAGSAAADWLQIIPEQATGHIDVRFTLRTSDHALIFVQYYGRMQLTSHGIGHLYSAPRFETADARYSWLNAIQAVGKGEFDANAREVRYVLFEVT